MRTVDNFPKSVGKCTRATRYFIIIFNWIQTPHKFLKINTRLFKNYLWGRHIHSLLLLLGIFRWKCIRRTVPKADKRLKYVASILKHIQILWHKFCCVSLCKHHLYLQWSALAFSTPPLVWWQTIIMSLGYSWKTATKCWWYLLQQYLCKNPKILGKCFEGAQAGITINSE